MSEITNERIYEIIADVNDPDLLQSLGKLNSIEKIDIHNSKINIDLRLTQPIHWVAGTISRLCTDKIKAEFPDSDVEISITEKHRENGDQRYLKGVKNIIAVASGKGGVGKSSIASNIAAALSLSGASVGILDGDVYGPSQPIMFGMEGDRLQAMETEDGKTIAVPGEKYGIKVVSMGFVINRDEAAIVRGPMLAGYFSMLFEQVEWGALDFLVFDLPPGTGDIQLTLTQKIPLTGAVIVTTPQDISLADVRRSIAMFNRVNVDIIGVVENMSWFEPPDMPGKRYFIFGEGGGEIIAEETGVKLLGEVPLDIDMRKGNDGGMPVVLSNKAPKQTEILKDITANIISEIRKLNSIKESSHSVKIDI